VHPQRGERDANVAITIFFADRGPVTRVDSRHAEVSLLSTVAYAEG
jgi:hypothetical protein